MSRRSRPGQRVRSSVLGSMAAGPLGHRDGGGSAAAVAGGNKPVQHPILTALEGQSVQVSGEEVLDGIGQILSRLLPDVPRDDPYRACLEALAAASRCQPQAQRPRLEAL